MGSRYVWLIITAIIIVGIAMLALYVTDSIIIKVITRNFEPIIEILLLTLLAAVMLITVFLTIYLIVNLNENIIYQLKIILYNNLLKRL